MEKLRQIRTKALFAVVLSLKIVLVSAGWLVHSPVLLGSVAPLTVMAAYIAIGSIRKDRSLTDEKFADSCYYLGFIFTITSIIFSLFDLPSIGTHIQDIAFRFGAAMISTVLGLGVRVYLIGFKRDASDAIHDAEEAVVDAAQNLREHLVMSVERFKDFQSEVDVAARGTVERVNLQIEALAKNHSDKLTEFFTDLTQKNETAFKSALEEVHRSSMKLADAVDRYTIGMGANLQSIGGMVQRFTDGVMERLEATTFPDDYFSKHLALPLSRMQAASSEVSESVRQTSGVIGDASTALNAAVRKLQTKSAAIEGSLDTVLQLSQQQEAILQAAQKQVANGQGLASAISDMSTVLGAVAKATNSNNATSTALSAELERSKAEGAQQRDSFDRNLTEVKAAVFSLEKVLALLSEHVGASIEASHLARQSLELHSGTAKQLSSSLQEATTSHNQSSSALTDAVSQSIMAASKIDSAVGALAGSIERMSALDGATHGHLTSILEATKKIERLAVTATDAAMSRTPSLGGQGIVLPSPSATHIPPSLRQQGTASPGMPAGLPAVHPGDTSPAPGSAT